MNTLNEIDFEQFAALDDEALTLIVDKKLNIHTHRSLLQGHRYKNIKDVEPYKKKAYVSFLLLLYNIYRIIC